MRCKNRMFLSKCFKSIATVSLKSLANGRLTTGLGGVLLNFKHMSQLFVMSSTNYINRCFPGLLFLHPLAIVSIFGLKDGQTVDVIF